MSLARPRTWLVKTKDFLLKANSKAKALTFKAKAKDLTLEAKAKDSKFVLEDTPRPRTKAKDNNTVSYPSLGLSDLMRDRPIGSGKKSNKALLGYPDNPKVMYFRTGRAHRFPTGLIESILNYWHL